MPVKNFTEKSMQTRIHEEPFETAFLKKNKLYKLEKLIDWESLETQINSILIIKDKGRPKHPTRFMVALLMLQVLQNEFDKGTSETLEENIVWQYFCGIRYLSDLYSVSEKSIRTFRNDIAEKGLNIIINELLKTAIEIGLVKKKSVEHIIVDTTVQQKNIQYPHQANLLEKSREKIVGLTKKYKLNLNNTYAKASKVLMSKIWLEFEGNIKFYTENCLRKYYTEQKKTASAKSS